MSQINDLLQDSQAQFRAQRNETKTLVSKWEKTGLLEGVDAEYDKHNTAILLENQARQLISEANATNTSAAQEDWNGVALPLVRRIFGEISAKEFVSVQPMNLPSGLVFWMDFKYGTNKGANGKTSLFGNTAKDGAADLTKGLYGNDGAGFGKEVYSLNAATSASVVLSGAYATPFAMTDIDENLYKAAYFVSTSGVVTNAASVASGVITFGTVGGDRTGDVRYYKVDTIKSEERGDFEDTNIAEMGTLSPQTAVQGKDMGIPEIEVNLEQEALVAKTRKLKVKCTPEFAQDLNAYHSIDAEAELTSMLSEYISMEIDMEILSMLQQNAAFDYTHTFPTLSGGMTISDQLATLGATVQKVSNVIHQSTMRGGANFMVCSPTVATYFENIPGYSVDTDGTGAKFAMGVKAVGSLRNRYTIYKNPYWTGDTILAGFRGNQFLETGAVFAPYIPLIMTPLVYDPTNFTPRKGVMTRYAKKVVRKDYYAVIQTTATNLVGLGSAT